MKKMKKIVTLLLALAMVFSSIGVIAEEATTASNITFSDVTPGTKVADAVTKLVSYNVITGYEDGTFKPDGEITRAEFAAVITRFKGIAQSSATDVITGFSDLDNDSSRAWARPYVKAAADAGIINGFEDGTFRAAEPVTYEQAVKMIVCAIGYEPIAQSEYNKLAAMGSANLTWSSGYIAAANKNGITLNAIMGIVTNPASRGIVAILTSNAYDAPKINTSTDKDGNTIYEVGSGTIGEENYNTREKIEGVVSATFYTGLTEQAPNIEMNEIKIKTSTAETTYTLSDDLMKTTDLEAILGKKVTAYYAKDEYAIVSLTESGNSVITIKEQDIVRPISPMSISYTENGRTRTANINGDYTIIYNGKSGYISDFSSLDSMFNSGTIEINTTTSVVKINSYEVFVVNNYAKNEGNGKVYLKYGKTYNGNNYYEFPAGVAASKIDIYVNGAKKDFASLSLSSYNVINYMTSPSVTNGNKITRMYVTTGSKSGTVTAGNVESDRLVYLGDKEMYLTNDYYNYTPGTEQKAPFELDDRYTYYLDYFGQIAAINYSVASAGSFEMGFVLGADDEQIRLLRKDGSKDNYDFKKNVKIDGEGVPADEVKTALETIAATELNALREEIDVVDGTDKYAAYRSDIYQPVRVTISGGEVSAIDTVKTVGGGSGDTFVANALFDKDASLPQPTSSSVSVGGSTYQLNSSTLVIYVPANPTAEALYSVMTPSKAFSTKKAKKIEIFGADATGLVKTAGLVLVYGTDPTLSFSGTSPYMIVTRTLKDGKTIEGYKSGEKEISPIDISEERFSSDITDKCVDYTSVSKGDLIRYITDASGVIAIEMIYDASDAVNNLNTDDGLTFSDTDGTDIYMYYAEAYAKMPEDSMIWYTTEFSGDDEAKEADGKFASTKYSSSTTFYSKENGEIIAGDNVEVISDKTAGSRSRIIIIKTGTQTANAKVVYVAE